MKCEQHHVAVQPCGAVAWGRTCKHVEPRWPHEQPGHGCPWKRSRQPWEAGLTRTGVSVVVLGLQITVQGCEGRARPASAGSAILEQLPRPGGLQLTSTVPHRGTRPLQLPCREGARRHAAGAGRWPGPTGQGTEPRKAEHHCAGQSPPSREAPSPRLPEVGSLGRSTAACSPASHAAAALAVARGRLPS